MGSKSEKQFIGAIKGDHRSEMDYWHKLFIIIVSGALRDLVPFVQFEKHEKHPWRSITFSKVAGNFTKSNTPPCVLFTLF